MGGTYKEQKELDALPMIDSPSLLTTKGSKPSSRKDKRLIVLNNFTSVKACTYIMREMKDASTDIIIVSNELFCKEEIAKDFDKHFSRGCNIIEVTSLQPISIMQRMVYALLEKNSFVARDTDHIVFTLLSEYSRGAATIVHMLTSLMQKSEDNSRTGFELAKQQLKLHIAHRKLQMPLIGNDTYCEISSILDVKTYCRGENMDEMDPQVIHTSQDRSSLSSPQFFTEVFLPEITPCDSKNQTSISELKINETSPSIQPSHVHKSQEIFSEDREPDVTSYTSTTDSPCMGIQNEVCLIPHTEGVPNDTHCIDDNPHGDSSDDVLYIRPEGHKVISSANGVHKGVKDLECTQVHAKSTGDKQTMVSSISNKVASSDSQQIDSLGASEPPTTVKSSKKHITSTHEHPLYMYINDILANNISLPAHHLLNSLVITGPIPLPLFYVEELNNVVMNAVISKEKKNIKPESPMKQLLKGVIRNSCYPIVYHKNLNPDDVDTTIQSMFVPKLICDAVNDQMDDVDKALSVLSAQRALENIMASEKCLVHLRYLLVICDQLHTLCSEELQKFGDHLLIASLKLKFRVSNLIHN